MELKFRLPLNRAALIQKKGPGDGKTWPKATAFLGVFGGRGLDGVWPGFSVTAFRKDKRLQKSLV
jgi:hypothetical protein